MKKWIHEFKNKLKKIYRRIVIRGVIDELMEMGLSDEDDLIKSLNKLKEE